MPDGLRYAADFIPEAAERDLFAHVAALPLQPFQFGQYEGKRRVASFGWRYDYSERRLTSADPIPDWMAPLIEQVEAFGGPQTRIEQVEGQTVMLSPELATPFGLVIHELATNAIKYGALSNNSGTVSISWLIQLGNDYPLLRLNGESKVGPPLTLRNDQALELS